MCYGLGSSPLVWAPVLTQHTNELTKSQQRGGVVVDFQMMNTDDKDLIPGHRIVPYGGCCLDN